jgi:Domain of unknown function DUF29
MLCAMPDGVYERDFLAWSQYQADLIRRLGRAERAIDVDWAHVAGEIEDVGLSKSHLVDSFVNLLMVHLLTLHASPGSDACPQWRGEVVAFRSSAKRRFAPSDGAEKDETKILLGASL